MHGIVTSPVSVPAILYAAGNLSKRGRNNHKINRFSQEILLFKFFSDFNHKLACVNGDMSEVDNYFMELSNQLQPIIKSKFWA